MATAPPTPSNVGRGSSKPETVSADQVAIVVPAARFAFLITILPVTSEEAATARFSVEIPASHPANHGAIWRQRSFKSQIRCCASLI